MTQRNEKSGSYHHGDLRDELLQAAVEVAAERGLHGLSLRECARRAGVSHAAPYRHFADKDALLLALGEQGDAWLAEAGRAAMAGIDDAQERLDAYGVAYVRFAVEHPVHFRIMFTSELNGPTDGETDDGETDDGETDDGKEGAFDLLVRSAAEATGTTGEQALVAGFASWCVPHGLAMLLLDGRVPSERAATPEQIDELSRTVLTLWRRGT